MPKPMFVWSGSAWVSVATEVESLATYATQSYADNLPGSKLIVPTSVAVGSGTGSVSTQGAVTFSGASSVSINNAFSSTYDNYKIVLEVTTASATGYITSRLRASGSDNTTSNYSCSMFVIQHGTSGTNNDNGGTGQTSFNKFGYVSTGSKEYWDITLFNPFKTNETAYCAGVVPIYAAEDWFTGGRFNATTSFDGITFAPASGTFAGTIRVYGLKNG